MTRVISPGHLFQRTGHQRKIEGGQRVSLETCSVLDVVTGYSASVVACCEKVVVLLDVVSVLQRLALLVQADPHRETPHEDHAASLRGTPHHLWPKQISDTL